MQSTRGDLNRHSSHRGKKPPINIGRKSLPRSTSPDPAVPKVYYLVICGAKDPKHTYIFSDFMGFCMMLKEKNIFGDFVSCFPLRLAFKYLKNMFNVESIKFGKFRMPNTTEDAYMYEYTSETFQNHPLWFIEQKTEDLKDYVIRWITDTAQKAVPGDTVNIIFEGHGHTLDSAMILGERSIKPLDFINLFNLFQTGVQVNSISGACYSGAFVDAISASGQGHRYSASATSATAVAKSQTRASSGRIRNSRYSQAFVQSFACMSLPNDLNPSSTNPTIDEHHAFMTQQIARNITPGNIPDPDQYTTTAPITGQDLVLDVNLNNLIDVVYDPEVTHRRRRLEWPRRNDPCFANLGSFASTSVPESIQRFVSGVVASEFSKCGGENQSPVDSGCMDELVAVPLMRRRPQNLGALIHALYYRARQQSACWDMYSLLVDKHFINGEVILTLVDLTALTPAVQRVSWLLSCFDLPNNEQCEAQEMPYELFARPFLEPIAWLATMIVRGCSDVEALFDTIRASGFLGALNNEAYHEYKRACHPKSFNINPKEREGKSKECGPFGFWLPHGVQDATTVYPECLKRFNDIEEGFKLYYRLGDEKVLLERNQVSYTRLQNM